MLLYNIFAFNPVSGFDYLQIHLNPGCRHKSIPHTNVDTEYIVVTKGTLEMIINDETIILKEGHALSFRGNSEHTYANPTDELSIFQNVIQYI
ncbi:MAG: cupin domain-containing protein [Eubacteriales bacterium]|nr:cupin domain-containing protein [Eubacteriales bacterium]